MLKKKCGRMPWAGFKTSVKIQYLYVCFSIFSCKDFFPSIYLPLHAEIDLLHYLNVSDTYELT